jgi:hypothetical protein
METGTTKPNQSPPNLLQQILSPKAALIVGAVLVTLWIYFLGFETVRLVEDIDSQAFAVDAIGRPGLRRLESPLESFFRP